MLSQIYISVAYQHEHDLILVLNLQSQTKQTSSQRELRDRLEEEDLKSKLYLSMRRNEMAMLTMIEQCILELKEVKLKDQEPGSNHLKDLHLLLTVMRLRW